jgi:CBS domain-containing protein
MTKIKDIMTKNVLTLTEEKPLMEVIKVMSATTISCIVVTNEQNEVVGLITERDLIKKVLLEGKTPKKLKLADIMTTNLMTADPEDYLHDIGQKMKEKNIRHMPVVLNKKLAGIVTQSDIARETHELSRKNVQFMTYQNIQVIVIIVLFIFLLGYVIYMKVF